MFITMDLGTSMSRKVRVRLVELVTFPIDDKARVIQVRRGDPLKIPCKPPRSVPSNPQIEQDYDGQLSRCALERR